MTAPRTIAACCARRLAMSRRTPSRPYLECKELKMKVLVTGGSGQVGSTVIDLLLGRGDDVVAIDNFATGRRDNLSPHPRLHFVEDSIARAEVMGGLIGDFRP